MHHCGHVRTHIDLCPNADWMFERLLLEMGKIEFQKRRNFDLKLFCMFKCAPKIHPSANYANGMLVTAYTAIHRIYFLVLKLDSYSTSVHGPFAESNNEIEWRENKYRSEKNKKKKKKTKWGCEKAHDKYLKHHNKMKQKK